MDRASTSIFHKLFQDFTGTERDILAHRLEVPDAVADCLPQFRREEVVMTCEALSLGAFPLWTSRSVVRAILQDCIESSTWVALLIEHDGTSADDYADACASLRHLSIKLQEHLGIYANYVPVA